MTTQLVEGYTAKGFSRAFDVVQERTIDMAIELGYLDTNVGDRPFCAAHTIFSTAVIMLAEMGWSPEEIARDATDFARDHLRQK